LHWKIEHKEFILITGSLTSVKSYKAYLHFYYLFTGMQHKLKNINCESNNFVWTSCSKHMVDATILNQSRLLYS